MYSDGEPVLFEDDVFKVELPLSSLTDSGLPINTDKRIEMILSYIRENGSITNNEACHLLRLSSSSVKKLFEKMVKSNKIIPVGEKKSRKYVLTE